MAANTNGTQSISVDVIIEQQLSRAGDSYRILYSNGTVPKAPGPVVLRAAGAVQVAEVDGSTGFGPLHTIRVTLDPMEAQAIGK